MPNEKGYIHISSVPDNLTSRPIVSNINSVTSKLSALIDAVLKPCTTLVPSYIRDSHDFISKLPKRINVDTTFVSWDICSLYTKIPNELGILAVQYWLSKDVHDPRLSKIFIIKAVKIVLKFNTFKWKNRFFRQINGVAMGTKAAPIYAILTIGFLEIQFYNTCANVLGEIAANYIKTQFRRFLDDCFIIWECKYGPIEVVTNILNGLDSNIQYTVNMDRDKLPFLDILIYRRGDALHTDLYVKSTDSQVILSFTSNHPRHILRNIPYVLAKRIKTLVSEPRQVELQLKKLSQRLMDSKYPRQLVMDALNIDYCIGNRTIDNNTNKTKIYPLVFPYHRKATQVTSSLQRSIESLRCYNSTRHILQNNRTCLSFKSSPKLLQIIKKPTYSITKCNQTRCKTCQIIVEGGAIHLPNRQALYPNANMNCCTKNVIYCLICDTCFSIYIGQTQCMLRNRMTLHRQHTNHPQYAILYCNKHFHTCGGHFKVIPLFTLIGIPTLSQLLFIEDYFKRLLDPELNKDI